METTETYTLSQKEKNIIALANQAEETLNNYKAIKAKLDEALLALPIGQIFQDPETGVVYQIKEPTGTYVEFRKIEYVRTRKEGETKGTLSMKEAEAAGFKIGKEKE